MRALIAEDEITLANNIKLYLEHQEFDGDRFSAIDVVENGAAALQILDRDYDFVLLDLKMPEVDGTQVVEALNRIRHHKRPSVILITAFPGAYETTCMAIKMGVQALLKKPFEL